MAHARRRHARRTSALLAFALLTGACSGGGFPGDDAPQPILLSPADQASPTPGTSGTPTKGPKGSPGPGETPGGGTDQDGDGEPDPTFAPPPVANLFTPSEDRIGITDDQITLCGHAALTYAAAFNTQPEDLNVYWETVNATGGVHGRRVEMTYEDDAYSPTQAVVAAQACLEKDPFILVGGIGFDQIPAVRSLVEDKHVLYVHHVARQDYSKRYSFSALPTVEQMGRLAAQWIATQHRGKRVGALYRASENWSPGYDAFVAELRRLKADFALGVPVQADQRTYSTQLNTLQNAGAEVVFGWENALNITNMVQQGKSQGWSPQWVVFPFNLETDTLGQQALNPPLEGIAAWSAFSPGDFGGPFQSYAEELHRFVDAYRQQRPHVRNLTDLHWQVWLAWRMVHQLLLACGPDCTRNKIVGLLLSRKYGSDFTHPDCPIDFTRNGHVGGHAVSFFRAYGKGAGLAGWRPIPEFTCVESLE